MTIFVNIKIGYRWEPIFIRPFTEKELASIENEMVVVKGKWGNIAHFEATDGGYYEIPISSDWNTKVGQTFKSANLLVIALKKDCSEQVIFRITHKLFINNK